MDDGLRCVTYMKNWRSYFNYIYLKISLKLFIERPVTNNF
jgi:hypothetical protein